MGSVCASLLMFPFFIIVFGSPLWIPVAINGAFSSTTRTQQTSLESSNSYQDNETPGNHPYSGSYGDNGNPNTVYVGPRGGVFTETSDGTRQYK